jgi:hypothetical protein
MTTLAANLTCYTRMESPVGPLLRRGRLVAQLRDERGQARLGDMDAGPEDRMQLLVRHGIRPVSDEGQQQVERLWRERDVDPRSSHDARADVDDNRALRLHYGRIIREAVGRSALAMASVYD